MRSRGQVLLVNPWIYDFAAHNLWIEPIGLLTIAAVLQDSSYGVSVLDCLAPHAGAPQPRPDGSGRFLKTFVDKPHSLAHIPRRYGRYGLPLDQFDARLAASPTPEMVMVTTGMTYWYPGVVEAIRRVRAHLGRVPVVLGGVYATLCTDHAQQQTGADLVIAGPGQVAALRFADEVTGNDSGAERYAEARTAPAPAHELVQRSYAGIVTSWGCPYRCTYCASQRLQPGFVQREPAGIVSEMAACVRRGILDFAFYDDALLVDVEGHLTSVLEGLLAERLRVRLHTPNGLHAGQITARLAKLMRQAGFATVRLSLETIDANRQRATGGKVTTDAFQRAVGHLQAAGFRPEHLGAYILAGLPEQPLAEVEATVRFVHRQEVQAKLALFSPIPGTPDGDRMLPPDADPLLHNNTAYPYLRGAEYVREMQRIKQLAKEGNEALKAG
jgi:radical SAM superfamily enzyme YgiQ (UPF0313 family)